MCVASKKKVQQNHDFKYSNDVIAFLQIINEEFAATETIYVTNTVFNRKERKSITIYTCCIKIETQAIIV